MSIIENGVYLIYRATSESVTDKFRQQIYSESIGGNMEINVHKHKIHG